MLKILYINYKNKDFECPHKKFKLQESLLQYLKIILNIFYGKIILNN